MVDVFDLVDVPMHREDDRHAPHEQDQNSQEDQPVEGDGVIVEKGGPRADCAKPDENGQIQKHVDGWLQ